MKKKVLAMLIVSCMLAGLTACGKDTKKNTESTVQDAQVDESFAEIPVESSITIELGESEEDELS